MAAYDYAPVSAKVDVIDLEQIPLVVSRMIRQQDLGFPVEVYARDTMHGFIVNVEAKLMGKQASRTVQVDTPANWWEMLKDAHAPKWFRKRWPVKWNHKSIQVEYFAVCPHMNIESKEKHIRFPVMQQQDWGFTK